jgi:alkylated DNA repair protein alkB family protein 1
MTLGGQYNWTSKAYPTTAPPPFPLDTTRLLIPLFPLTHPTAAIANFYSPGDTLSVHRDVAESSPTGLISLSLGCDAIFVIGTASQGEEGEKVLALRLRSGSAVYMEAGARFAWHGVPRIVGGTCPGYLESWPAGKGGDGEEYEEWKGWMTGKRVNLNVRQMWD